MELSSAFQGLIQLGSGRSKGRVKSVWLEVVGVTVRLVCADFTSQNINLHLCQNGNMLNESFFPSSFGSPIHNQKTAVRNVRVLNLV